MVTVKFYEISRDRALVALERKINLKLRGDGLAGCSVRLFRTQDDRVGYSAQVSQVAPSAEGKRVLDAIHRAVCEATGYKRGRPPAKPTRQVKCRVTEDVYRKLVLEAKRQETTPSTLVARFVSRRVSR